MPVPLLSSSTERIAYHFPVRLLCLTDIKLDTKSTGTHSRVSTVNVCTKREAAFEKQVSKLEFSTAAALCSTDKTCCCPFTFHKTIEKPKNLKNLRERERLLVSHTGY